MRKEEFVSYDLVIELQKIDFNEPCIAFYNGKFLEYKIQGGDICSPYLSTENRGNCPNAPTFSQCFSWFREKYNIDSEFYMNHEYGIKFYTYLLLELKGSVITHLSGFSGRFETHEEAQLECLKKLIEIVNENKKN